MNVRELSARLALSEVGKPNNIVASAPITFPYFTTSTISIPKKKQLPLLVRLYELPYHPAQFIPRSNWDTSTSRISSTMVLIRADCEVDQQDITKPFYE
jgi:hypothetical protein